MIFFKRNIESLDEVGMVERLELLLSPLWNSPALGIRNE